MMYRLAAGGRSWSVATEDEISGGAAMTKEEKNELRKENPDEKNDF